LTDPPPGGPALSHTDLSQPDRRRLANPQNAAWPTSPRPAWTTSQTEGGWRMTSSRRSRWPGYGYTCWWGSSNPALGSGVLPLRGHPASGAGQPEPSW